MNLRLARGIFGTLVGGALGFGATQALAAPAQAAFYGCTSWQAQQCQDYCTSTYGLGSKGRCTNFGMLQCQCEYGPYLPDDP